MSDTHTTTKYRVTTDGVTPCLTGHGITEVDPIDNNTAIVTVAGNGVMFEQHAATCKAILEIKEMPATLTLHIRRPFEKGSVTTEASSNFTFCGKWIGSLDPKTERWVVFGDNNIGTCEKCIISSYRNGAKS